MALRKQHDLFVSDLQSDLFGAEPVQQYAPDPDKVRARLHKLLAEARTANVIPWRPAKLSLYRTIFPQIARFLPQEEGAQLCFQFEEELARLEAA